MSHPFARFLACSALCLLAAPVLCAMAPDAPQLLHRDVEPAPMYLLGAGDEISVNVADMPEMSAKSYRIDPRGDLHLPVLGNVKAAGLAIEKLEAAISDKLRKTLLEPKVSVTVVSFQSQPISILGAVNQPGIHQLHGPNRLLEAISWAGGGRQDAGDKVHITRQAEWGPIPLAGSKRDSSGKVFTAEVSLGDLTSGRGPEKNIYLRPYDVVSVDRAELIYVLGEVNKSGGFTLIANEKMSVLQALALAGGLQRTASPKNARILRKHPEDSERAEIRVDVRKILNSEIPDVPLRAEDVLFIPNNFPRTVALRAAEAAIQMGTGLVLFRR